MIKSISNKTYKPTNKLKSMKKNFFHFAKVLIAVLLLIITETTIKAQTIAPNYVDGKVYFKLLNSSDTIPVYNGTGETPAYIADLVAKYNVTKLYRPFVSANSIILKSIYRMEFSNIASVEQVITDLKAIY